MNIEEKSINDEPLNWKRVRFMYWKAETSFYPGNYHLYFYAGRDRHCIPPVFFDIPRDATEPRFWAYEVQFFQQLKPICLRAVLSKVLSDEELDDMGIIPGFVQAGIKHTTCYKIISVLMFISDMEAES